MSTTISVIVPTHDRPRQLRACLDALAASELPRETFEVLVVDDGGAEPLARVIEPLRAALPIRLVRRERGGPAAARNTGAELAGGALLAFTDDDCLPEPAWLSTLWRVARERPGHLIGGATVNALEGNPFSAASQRLVSYLYDYTEKQRGNPRWAGFFTSNNLAVPAEGFRRIGGFDARFPLAAGEDRDFCDRWSEAGLPAHFAPGAVVRHAHRLGLPSYLRQHWNYGRGALHFQRARARRGAPPLRPQHASFYMNLVRYPFAHERWPRAALEAALLAASQCANAAGYYYERRARRTVER